jgi:uncharacterized protein
MLRSLILLMAALIAAPLGAQTPSADPPPIITARVLDEAVILSPEAVAELEAELAAIADQTGLEVVLLTNPDLKGEEAERVSLRRLIEWTQGKPRPLVGALFLLAPNDRVTSLANNFALPPGDATPEAKQAILQQIGGFLTNMQRSVEVIIRPILRQGDFPGGLRAFAKLAASEAPRHFTKAEAATP